MKRMWGVKKAYYLSMVFFLIIASFVLLNNSNANGKTVSDAQAAGVLNKEDAKTNDIQKETTKDEELDKAAKAKIQESYGKLPMYFIQNNGQVDEKVRFYEKGSGHATYFTEDGVFLTLAKGEEKEKSSAPDKPTGVEEKTYKSELVRLSFLNANNARITAEGLMDGRVNYFIGSDTEKWRSDIPTYGAVVYSEVYEGVDVKFYGNNRLLEYDIIVKPGADPSMVRLSYEGIEGLQVTESGDLYITMKEGGIIQKKPYVYQEIEGKRVEIDGRFRIIKEESGFAYGFDVASYSKDSSLVIDPVLVYSTGCVKSLFFEDTFCGII